MTAPGRVGIFDRDLRAHLRPTDSELAVLDLYGVPVEGWEQYEVAGLVVGEMPGRGTRPELPMLPCPATSAGGRLMIMSGLPSAEYVGRLGRINVYERWESDDDLARFRGSGPDDEQSAQIRDASMARYRISAVEPA